MNQIIKDNIPLQTGEEILIFEDGHMAIPTNNYDYHEHFRYIVTTLTNSYLYEIKGYDGWYPSCEGFDKNNNGVLVFKKERNVNIHSIFNKLLHNANNWGDNNRQYRKTIDIIEEILDINKKIISCDMK